MRITKNQIYIVAVYIATVSCSKGDTLHSDDERQQLGSKPNVILILADDMGYGDISGLNKESKIITTGIDKLCSSGIIFTNAHSSSSMSTPSRYSILTGRYPWRTTLKQGVLNGYSPAMITPDRKTLGNLFQSNGYNTACIGKWHLGLGWKKNGNEVDFSQPISDGPIDRGFDYFYGIAASLDMPPYVYIENNKVTQLPTKILPGRTGLEMMNSGIAAEDFVPEEVFSNITERAIDYIIERKKHGIPFFLYLPLTAPHTPILPAPEYKGKSIVGAYGDFVLMIDNMIQNIIETLKSIDLYDNTIIVFASDNGCAPYIGIKKIEEQGHYPSYIYRGYKSDIYEGGHRIPLIISWPAVTCARKYSKPICLSDFYATFADMLNTPLTNNEGEDSFSFYDILCGNGNSKREDIVVTSNDGSFALTNNEMKVIFTSNSGGWSEPASGTNIIDKPTLQVYNLSEDIKETVNLYGIDYYYVNIAEVYKKAMRRFVDNGRTTPGEVVTNDTENNWPQTKLFK